MTRENPASAFIAHTLAEIVHGPWDTLPDFVQRVWRDRASKLINAMYEAGFTIPQPADPDAVWADLGRPTPKRLDDVLQPFWDGVREGLRREDAKRSDQ